MTHLFWRYTHFIFILSLVLICSACEKRQIEEPLETPINIYKSGELIPALDKNGQNTIYIDVRDETGQVPVTPVILRSLLEADNYEIVDAPSKAAYILHISILQEGSASADNVEEIVRQGYGAPAIFKGGDGSGWIADALLVKRRVPSEKREIHKRLKNISSRNALNSSQQRIGLSSQTRIEGRPAHVALFGQPLAKALHAAITGREDGGFD